MQKRTYNKEQQAILELSLVDGVGPGRFRNLLNVFGSAASAMDASFQQIAEVVGPSTAARIAGRRRELAVRAAQVVKRMEEVGGRTIPLGHPGYPERLCGSAWTPPVLYVVGRLEVHRSVAIVGCRRARGSFFRIAREMGSVLAGAGITVISGGAYGIDAAAHRGALDAGGPTVCVLGGGFDHLYPDRHLPLFEDIARSGALATPFPPETVPMRGCFLSRNRVIAGLAEATVVVEAGHRSGARSTALSARALGRPVIAVTGSPGTARLLSEGAVPARCGHEVIDIINGKPDRGGAQGAEDLSSEENSVLAALGMSGAATVDTLADRCKLPISRVSATLTTLELAGFVVGLPGGQYTRIGPPGTGPSAKKT